MQISVTRWSNRNWQEFSASNYLIRSSLVTACHIVKFMFHVMDLIYKEKWIRNLLYLMRMASKIKFHQMTD